MKEPKALVTVIMAVSHRSIASYQVYQPVNINTVLLEGITGVSGSKCRYYDCPYISVGL